MALDFPSNPTNGQIYNDYYWDQVEGIWNFLGSNSTPNILSNGTFTSGSSVTVPITVTGASSQSANLQEWKTSAGATMASVSPNGALSLNTALTVQNGGTGATNASDARSSLGVQPSADPIFTGTVSAATISASQRVIGTTPNDSGSTGGLAVKAPAGGSQTSAYIQFVNNAYSAQYGAIEATSSGSMNLSASYVRTPSQPSCLSFRASGGNFSQGTGVLPFTSIKHNTGNNYNTGNSRFTAPVAGVYAFSVHFNCYGASGATQQASILINGSLQYSGTRLVRNGTGDQDVNMSITVYLNANDYVQPYANLSTSLSFSSGEYWSHFSAHLLG